jgi:outer membrane receptor protein involved in Fe transport
MSRRKACLGLAWYAGAGAAPFILASPVLAQEGSRPVLEEIVVTANKRLEDVQDVASSVSVVTGETLQEQQRSQVSDYLAYMAGVSSNSTGSPGQTALTIRGISPLSSTSKVATYIDETPLGSSGIWAMSGGLTLDLLPFDLNRVELLRGPQGTLYGASSMGGLLKYVLTTPNTKEFSAEFAADGASVASAHNPAATLEGHVNLPIVADVLGASASAFYRTTPGYIDNAYRSSRDTNEVKQYGGRVAAFWQPAANLTVKFNALWQTTESADDAVTSYLNPTLAPPTTTGPSLVSGGTSYGRLTESEPFDAPYSNRLNFYSATVDWTLGSLDLVSASSYSRTDNNLAVDYSPSFGTYFQLLGLPSGLVLANLDFGLRKFTQEIRLTSPQTDIVSWQVGGFYTDERESNTQALTGFDTTYQPIPALAPYFGLVTIPTTYKEYAAFGDVTWKVLTNFDVTGGVRFSQNHQVFNDSQEGILFNEPQTPLVALPTVRSKENDTTWMASARYHFTPDVMLFARAATGYAPGGANTPYPGVPQPTVGPEHLTSYELGLKSEFFEHRALLDLSVYHIDWRHIQLNALVNNISYVTNGGTAHSDGVELASSFSPFRGLTFGFNTAYTKAELKSLDADVSSPFLLDTQLQSVPKWTVSGTADYGWSLSSTLMAHVGGGVRWIDHEAGLEAAIGQPYFVLPSYTVVDANASLVRGQMTYRLFATNLTNARAFSFGRLQQDVTGAAAQIDYTVMQPRTIGAGVMVKF